MIIVGDDPEEGAVGGEKQLAVDQQIAQRNPTSNVDITGHYQSYQHCSRYIRVGESHRLEFGKEQRISSHLADYIAGDDQEQTGAQQRTPSQITGVNV